MIVQDVRGRYTSDGEWYTFKHESDDGYDTSSGRPRLPYSNGKVGMWGGSYVGATQMLAAIAHPPHLAGICPVVTASNYHDGWTYQGGAFEQWFNQSWTSGLAARHPQSNGGEKYRRRMWERGSFLSPAIRFSIFQIPRPRRSLTPRWPRTSSIGWLIPATTNIGSRWRLKSVSPTSPFPYFTSRPGMTFFRVDRCATTSGSRPTAEVKRRAAASTCW